MSNFDGIIFSGGISLPFANFQILSKSKNRFLELLRWLRLVDFRRIYLDLGLLEKFDRAREDKTRLLFAVKIK
jgi:hypothetical protein